jgi:hypothetical protein
LQDGHCENPEGAKATPILTASGISTTLFALDHRGETMTQADAEGLCALADVLLANNKTQVQFKTGVKSESAGDYWVEIWNSSDQYTETLRTAQEFAEFFCTKFMLSPVFCFHRGEYRNPKDDPSRPFLCPHCERLSYTISLSEQLPPFSDSIEATITKAES